MKGGHRNGAGRKAGEKTVQIRIPTGTLEAVQKLVSEYKTKQSLNPAPTIKQKKTQPAAITPFKETKNTRLIIAPEINNATKPPLITAPEIREAHRQLTLLNRKEKRILTKKHGSLENAAKHIANEAQEMI